jgi:putative flippase GtrA
MSDTPANSGSVRARAAPTTRAFASRNFALFVLTGGFAAAVNWSSRILYSESLPYSYAIALAYVTGMITAFVLARAFVFTESRQSTARSACLFVLVNVIAVTQTWLVSIWLAYHALPKLGVTAHAREIAHLVGVVVPVFTSYLGHKHWSFRA